MKVTDHIKKANGKTLFSIEVLPPKKGQNIHHIFETMDELLPFDPAFVDVTYHREEFVTEQNSFGQKFRKAVRKRPGTVAIAAAIQNKYNIDTVPHIICAGFTKEDTENALIDLNFLGIDNVLALQGDKLKTEENFIAEEGGHTYASELVTQISKLNKGVYLDAEIENSRSTDFCIGVAAYPEKHEAAVSFEQDIKFLKQKIDLGGEYIVTQMFFDNSKYFEFVEKCRAAGITVPIIPGLKPLATAKHVDVLPRIFSIDMPEELKSEVLKYKDDREKVRQIGVEWCVIQSKELKQKGVPVLHYYTMSKADLTKRVAKEVF